MYLGTPPERGTDVTLADVARQWQASGVSVIPIAANQTKRPAIDSWKPFQTTAPTLGQVNEWWGNGKPYGLAVICGAVSGNLELLEIEGKVFEDFTAQTRIQEAMHEACIGPDL
jgi:hypothetical protein